MKVSAKKSVLMVMSILAVGGLVMLAGCEREQPAAHQAHGEVTTDAAKASEEYPITVCVVTGQPLDSMGGPVKIEHEGREVQLCCAGCEGAFRDDPEKYLAMLKKAEPACCPGH